MLQSNSGSSAGTQPDGGGSIPTLQLHFTPRGKGEDDDEQPDQLEAAAKVWVEFL